MGNASDLSETFPYIGTELEAFSYARNWKDYLHKRMKPFIKGDVLEVGAGIGNNTDLFSKTPHTSWTCIEPDAQLATRIPRVSNREVIVSTLASVSDRRVDSILQPEGRERHGGWCQCAATRLLPGLLESTPSRRAANENTGRFLS